MGGAGAADQPEVVALVHLSLSRPLRGAQVVPPEDCGSVLLQQPYLQAVAPDWKVADGDRRHVFCKLFNLHENTMYPEILQTRPP